MIPESRTRWRASVKIRVLQETLPPDRDNFSLHEYAGMIPGGTRQNLFEARTKPA